MLFKNQVSASEFVTGSFDCRQYKKDTPRNLRPMVEQGGRINLTITLTEEELPGDCKEFARKSSKNEKYYLTFKVFPKNCRMYTASAKQIAFPENSVLDGGRFEIRVDYSVKHGTGTELNGLYANSIQIIKRADVPFDAVDVADDDVFATHDDTLAMPEKIQIADKAPERVEMTQPQATTPQGLPF